MSTPILVIDLTGSDFDTSSFEEDPALAEASAFFHLMEPPYSMFEFGPGPDPKYANTSNGWIEEDDDPLPVAIPSSVGPSSLAPVVPVPAPPVIPPVPHYPKTVTPEVPAKPLLVYARRRKRASSEMHVSEASKEMAGPSKKQKEVWVDRCSHCDAQIGAIREELAMIQARLSCLYGEMMSFGEAKVLDDSAMGQMNARIQDLEMRMPPMRWNVGPSDPYNRMG